MGRELKRWLLLLMLLLGLGAAIVLSEHPTGSLTGQVGFPPETEGRPTAQVIATGPVVRGAYVDETGHYALYNLPTGSYQVQVSAPGYERIWLGEKVEVQEGQGVQLPDTQLQRLAPALNLYGTSQVFTSTETPQAYLSSAGLESVQIEIFAFDLEDYLDSPHLAELADPYGYGWEPATDITDTAPSSSWLQVLPEADEDGWSAITVELPQLQPGAYWLRARGQGSQEQELTATYWLAVTDLGLIQKQAEDQIVIEAVDLTTLEPLAGIDLWLFALDKSQRTPLLATTDAEGLARISIPTADQDVRQWAIYGQGAGITHRALSRSSFYGDSDIRCLTYTDRPLYRPGQTVYFRSILRQLHPQRGPQPLSGVIQVQVTTPTGDPIWEQSLDLNEFGTIHGQVQIPNEADLGSYEIELTTPSGESRSQFFAVEEYRKPEFDITVTPAQSWIQQGQSVQVTVEAEYLFGAPVAGAEVEYRVYRSSDWGYRDELLPRSPQESFFASELDRDRQGYYGGYGEVIQEGQGITDAGGVAHLQLDRLLQGFDWQGEGYWGEPPVQQVRIEVQVRDVSRRTVTQEGRLRVTQGEWALFLTTDQYVAEPGQSIPYGIRSLSYDRQPVSLSGRLALEQWGWDRRRQRYLKQRTWTTTAFQTEAGEGEATLTLPADLPMGDYRIRAEARDQQGHPIQDLGSLWVVNPGNTQGWHPGGAPTLQITPDRQVYEVGETAKIVIASPVPTASALVTLEGATLYEAKVQPIEDSLAVVEVPILAQYQPNLYFSVTLVGSDRRVYQQQVPLWVSPLDRFLSVQIETDQDQYLPGETAQIRVQTRDAQGQPSSAEVSLGVVDEAIYILRPDQTPDIRRFFYRRRYNQVTTSYSFPQQYPGGVDKLANQLRQRFEDTAAWFPAVVTDAQGEATVTVTLPDTLTTWRITALATTPDTQVGSAVAQMQVSKDLVVRLATPRFFSTGDRLQLTAVVQNQTDRPLVADVILETSSTLATAGERRQQIRLAPQAAQRVEWPTQVLRAGETVVRVSAQAGDLEDAVQLSIPAQPYGAEYRVGQRGSLTGVGSEVAQVELTLPEQVVPGSMQGSLYLAAHPAADLLGALDYLVSYPYGCTEQTLSRFLPSLAVAEAAEVLGLPLRSQTLERLPQTLAQGLRRLARLQNADGGWGWWLADGSNLDLTSYGVMGYHRAQAMGYSISPESEERSLRFLEQRITDPEPVEADSWMVAEYALSLWGRADLQLVRDLDPQQLSTWGQAYRTLTLLRLGDRAMALQSLTQLLAQVEQESGWIWSQPPQQREKSSSYPLWHRSTYQAVEIAAPVLEAATALNHPQADAIAQQILELRQGERWGTTKATADAITGLTQYYAARATKTPASYEVTIRNLATGAPLGRWSPDWDQSYQQLDLSPPDLTTAQLQPGPQTLAIEKVGTGPLYYSLTLSSTQIPSTDQSLGGEAEGFRVHRQYFTLTPQTQSDGTVIYQEIPVQGAVQAGEMLLGRIQVEAEQDANYVIIEDPLPSGAELSTSDPNILTGQGEGESEWGSPWTHQEVRDDRISVFATELSQGQHEFSYLFRPEIPGEFTIAPTAVEEMYNPTQVYGQGRSDRLRVTE